MNEEVIIKQASSSLIVRAGLLFLPISLMVYVALDGGMDSLGITFTIAFIVLAVGMLLWFSTKTIIFEGKNLAYTRLFTKRRTVKILKINEIERLFNWVPTAKTLAADSTLKLSVDGENPLIIPIEDINERDIQLMINLIRKDNPNVKLNKLAQRTVERKLTQYQLLTSNWQSFVVAGIIFIFIVLIMGLLRQLFN